MRTFLSSDHVGVPSSGRASADRIEVITDVAAMRALADPWNALADTTGQPFVRHEWFATWWEAFSASRRLWIVCAWRDDVLVGVLPLLASGPRLQAMANVHTPVYEPLARDTQALNALVGSVLNSGDELTLGPLPAESPAAVAVATSSGDRRRLVDRRGASVSPFVDTTGSLSEWRASSKSRWGAPLERFRRKMDREFDFDSRIIEPPRNLEAALQDGLRLEQQGWKGQAGTAILSSPDTTRFYRDLARAAHAAGMLRFSTLRLDGVLAAFDYTLLHGGRLYLLKTAYDEGYRRLAPGLVMRLSIIEECFNRGLEAHELLGGDDPWKHKFATGERRHVTIASYRRRLAPVLRYGYWRFARPVLRSAYHRARQPLDRRS